MPPAMMAQTVAHCMVWVIVPVEHFAISKHVGNAGQCDAEDGGIAELLEVDGETAGGIFMIRHSNEGDEDAK